PRINLQYNLSLTVLCQQADMDEIARISCPRLKKDGEDMAAVRGRSCLHAGLPLFGAAALIVALSCTLAGQAHAETLLEALSAAYKFNPRLDAARANLRATDEEVPRALAGYKPSVTGSADTSFRHITTNPGTSLNGDTNPRGYQIGLVQPLFRGFRTVNAV